MKDIATPTTDRLSPFGDEVYAALIATHDGLSDAESHALNARLVLLLANEVGDRERLLTLFREARGSASRDPAARHPAGA